MNVCAYCRVSTDKDDQINSFENQQQYFEKFIEQHSEWDLIEVYADEGVTGTNTRKRKNFNRMIQDAKDGKIDLILTKEVTRFARNTIDTLRYTRELKAIDVRVIFLIDNIDTFDPDGEFRLTIMASIAQEESRKTSERVKWGVAQQMKKGFVYSPSLLGYDVHKGVISVNPEEAKIVRFIFHSYAYENKTAFSIAKELIEKGVEPRKRMKTWSATAILRILRNEKYVGDLLQRKHYVKNFLDHKCIKNTDPSTMYFIENHHEAIIDRDTWDVVQAKLAPHNNISEPKQNVKGYFKASNKYWCSGKIRCGLCGKNFSIKTKKLADGTPYYGWKCIQRIKYGTQKINGLGATVGCNNNQINQKVVEQCVLFAYNTLIDSSDTMLKDFKNELKIQEIISDVDVDNFKNLMNKRDMLYRNKQRTIEMFVEGLITKVEFEYTKEKYTKEIVDIESRISAINQCGSLQSAIDSRVSKIQTRIDEIIKLREYQNKMFYEKIVEYIVAYPQRLEIHFYGIPFPFYVSYSTSGRGDKYTVLCKCINSEITNKE